MTSSLSRKTEASPAAMRVWLVAVMGAGRGRVVAALRRSVWVALPLPTAAACCNGEECKRNR
jgi:hypothetical protein